MSGFNNEEVLGNGQEEIVDQPTADMGAPQESQAEPANLVEAFKAIRSQNQNMAPASVHAGEPADQGEQGAGDAEAVPGGEQQQTQPAEGSDAGQQPTVLGNDGGQGEPGGSTAPTQDIDYGAYQKSLVDELSRQALQNVRKNFEQQKIQKISISQLYQRDENTGTVKFINPDEPDGRGGYRSFNSRAEAQQWCDAFNKDVDAEFQRAAIAERNKLLEEYRPTRELIEFAPKFQKFDQMKQGIINDMIQPYEIKGANGNVIGYRCNLDAVAGQADKLIARFKANQPQQQAAPAIEPKPQGSGPAIDMKSSGSGSTGSNEPKDLSEALKMYNSQKRSK